MARRNHKSAYQQPEEVLHQLQSEIRAGRLVQASADTPVHISLIGLIPKASQPGKWRLIKDLSSLRGASLNDTIEPELCSLKYAAIDQALVLIQEHGKGAVLAKMDLKSAYRMVPVHPFDQALLGLTWKGVVHTEAALPFGLRSAPKLFSAVADTLAWTMFCNGLRCFLHYLDDFLVITQGYEAAQTALQIALSTCETLHFPVASEKTVGPSTALTFLGIQIDTVAGTVSLPPEKLHQLHVLLEQWMNRRAPIKRDLLSLLGHLSHAATIIPPGRTTIPYKTKAATAWRVGIHVFSNWASKRILKLYLSREFAVWRPHCWK